MLKSAFRMVQLSFVPYNQCNHILHKWQNLSGVRAFANQVSIKPKVPEIKKRIGKKKKTVEEVAGRQGYWSIVAFSTGEEYNLEEIAQKLKGLEVFEQTTLSKEIQAPDLLHAVVRQDSSVSGGESQEVFIFREGAAVAWNVSEMDVEAMLSLLKKHQTGGYAEDVVREETELMNYTYGEEGRPATPTTLVEDDFVIQPNGQVRLDKFAVSNAIASSVKLGTWEALLSRYIDSMEDITNDLKSGAKIRMSQAEVLRRTGELFALRHAINLSSDLLDSPDIYWDREQLETIYQNTLSYFAVSKRTRVINEKINHCVELVDLLSSHLRDNHHVRLEWMIIILIMVEVMFEALRHIEDHGGDTTQQETKSAPLL